MPIKECTLPDGGSGWQWGDSGKCYASRKDAEKQAAAAHAHGYAGDTGLAFDKSVREIDHDGHLRIKVANISKATVNPYYGHEIPGWKELGLDSGKVYQLLRDPRELEKAAPSFNGKPLLLKHVPLTASEHPHEKVVGAVGNDVRWDAPYLKASLTVWDESSIAGIETGDQRDLSSAYYYDADMTPGEYDGASYDGVMRNLRGNHVALVEIGRAGSDVAVGDAALKRPKLRIVGQFADGMVRQPPMFVSPHRSQFVGHCHHRRSQ